MNDVHQWAGIPQRLLLAVTAVLFVLFVINGFVVIFTRRPGGVLIGPIFWSLAAIKRLWRKIF
jgi:hypothetical protein